MNKRNGQPGLDVSRVKVHRGARYLGSWSPRLRNYAIGFHMDVRDRAPTFTPMRNRVFKLAQWQFFKLNPAYDS